MLRETYIDILNVHITEPTTAFTDLLLALACLVFYRKLELTSITQRTPLKYWRLFFLFIGISTCIGAIAHGFRSYFSDTQFFVIWLLMNVTSIPSSFYLLKATIDITDFSNQKKKILSQLSLGLMMLLAVVTCYANSFLLIKINAGVVILITLIKQYATYKKGLIGSGNIVFGFVFSLSSIVVHSLKLSVNDYFNFKDISHVIMLISLYIIFMGVFLKAVNSSVSLTTKAT